MFIEGNRRRSVRVPSRLRVTWLRQSGEVQAYALNISVEGLFLRTDATIDVGMLMRLRIQLPRGTVNAVGVSRFVGDTLQGPGIGVFLYQFSDKDAYCWRQHYLSLLGGNEPSVAVDPPAVAMFGLPAREGVTAVVQRS